MINFLLQLAPTKPAGSIIVAGIFLLVVFAILFSTTWKGYWRGPWRQTAPFLASVSAGICAWFWGTSFGYLLFSQSNWIPWCLKGLAGSAVLGCIVWLCVFSFAWTLGRKQVSKTTGEPEYPILGAVIGCWTGLLWNAFLLIAIASLGILGDLLLCGNRKNPNSTTGKTAIICCQIRNSIGIIPGLEFVKTLNPIPDKTLRIIEKIVLVGENPQAWKRFLAVDEIYYISSLPSVYPVLNDPEILEKIHQRDIAFLLQDTRIARIFDDEDLKQALAEFDLEAALEKALNPNGKI